MLPKDGRKVPVKPGLEPCAHYGSGLSVVLAASPGWTAESQGGEAQEFGCCPFGWACTKPRKGKEQGLSPK